ncbi:hypothetical protein ACP4OV_014318 [Aristida adscensionis]
MSSKPLHDVLKWSSGFLSVARRFQTRIVEMPKSVVNTLGISYGEQKHVFYVAVAGNGTVDKYYFVNLSLAVKFRQGSYKTAVLPDGSLFVNVMTDKNLYALQNKGMMYKLDAELAFVRIKHVVPMADVEYDAFSILHPKNDVAAEVERRIEKKFSWNSITAPVPTAAAPSASNSLSTAGGTASAIRHGSAGDTAGHGSAGDSAGHGFGHGSDESAGATTSTGSDSESAPLSAEHGDEEASKRRRC